MESDNRNLIDCYKGITKDEKNKILYNWTNDMIKQELQKNAFPVAVLVENVIGSLNLGNCVRTSNAMGFESVYYTGLKKFDPRGSCGTYIYSNMNYLDNLDKVKELKNKYRFVGLENNIDKCISLNNYKWQKNTLIVIGEEGLGISQEMLQLCDDLVTIPMFGSVRSFNVSNAFAIAAYDYVNKVHI